MRRAVQIEADGGSRGNPGPAAYGAVLFDADTREVIAERAESIGVATNNVAEYRGLIAGLELFHEHAPEAELEVRMDSKLVVEQMSGRWKIKHPDMRPLAMQANRLAPPGTTYTWIPRAQNTHADRILNEALDRAVKAQDMPEDLMGLYEKLRASKGGVGAAALRARQCTGCSLQLTAADLGVIAKAPSNEVLRCEECDRILVRTSESGI